MGTVSDGAPSLFLETTRRCGGRDIWFFSCVIKPVRVDKLYEKTNVVITYIVECNHRNAKLVDCEEHIVMAIIVYIKFCLLHNQACSSRGTITERYCHQSELFIDIGIWHQLHDEEGGGEQFAESLGYPTRSSQTDAYYQILTRFFFSR